MEYPLRYNISSWRQLPQCLSNNSRELSIHVSDFMGHHGLRGFRISVDHTMFGTLFACVLNASGSIITPVMGYERPEDFRSSELTTDQILGELRKYGFIITYKPRKHLGGRQLNNLMTLQGLHYEKIRLLNVWKMQNGVQAFSLKVVAFNPTAHGQWLNNAYSASEKEFLDALEDGTAINLTEISETEKYSWDWLDYVANIDDILKDNAWDGITYGY